MIMPAAYAARFAEKYELGALTVVIWVLESLFEYWYGLLWRNLAQRLQHELRIDAYRHMQELEIAYFEDRSTGGLLSILGDDINQLERFLDSRSFAPLSNGESLASAG